MLKSRVGYSLKEEGMEAGFDLAKETTKGLNHVKLNLLFTSCKSDIKKIVKGIREITETPVIGCTSNGGIMVPDGYITSKNGYAGMMSLDDEKLVVGVACKEGGKEPRAIGRKVAIEAVENAGSSRAPAYFYMVASPKEEEAYLAGIQDVIGRVPMFGGSAADDDVSGDWKIICNDKILDNGVAVAFFYTDNEIETSFTGAYKETNNMGIITEVNNHRTLVSIDGISALKKYAQWCNVSPSSLKGINLLKASVTKPLGVKDPIGHMTVIRHPMFGNDNGTRSANDDTITLGNKATEKTAIIQLQASINDLVNAAGDTIKELRKKIYTDPAAYILFYDGARRMVLDGEIEEVYRQVLKETKGVPFMMAFTFGEYGYDDHSANICGGLMLSFTTIGKD